MSTVIEQQPTAVSESVNRLPILRLIKDAQQKHGLRQGNYLRYRGYCTRRIRRLRRSLKFTNSHKSFPKRPAKFSFRPVTSEFVIESRFIEIIVFEVERHWSYAMHLKLEIGDDLHDRRKFHMRQKLRRASKCARQLDQVVRDCENVDVSTKLEAQAYRAYIVGNANVEFKYWGNALSLFILARKVNETLSALQESPSLYLSRCHEIDNLIRLCRFNCGDTTEIPSVNDLVGEALDLDFNKLSVEPKEPKKEVVEDQEIIKVLEPIPCKPMFFDIAMNYRTKKNKA